MGGLLFAMEEVSSFWNMKMSWQVHTHKNTLLLSFLNTHRHSLSFYPVGWLLFAMEEVLLLFLFLLEHEDVLAGTHIQSLPHTHIHTVAISLSPMDGLLFVMEEVTHTHT